MTSPVSGATIEFDGVLRAGGPKQRNLMVTVPAGIDVKAQFGVANPPVVVHLDGLPPFTGRLAVMGGVTVFGLRQSQIAELGVVPDQAVRVRLVHDTAPRTVEPPAELVAAFAAAPEARAAFEALAPGQAKEFARWVGEAKQAATRTDRAAKAVARLRDGHKSPR